MPFVRKPGSVSHQDLHHRVPTVLQMRHKFEAAGGKVFERTVAQGVRVHPDGVALQLQADQHDVTGQLLIDCMGNFSPIVRQVLHCLHAQQSS